ALPAGRVQLLLGERLGDLRVLEHLVELLEPIDRLLDGLKIRQHTAQPARVDVEGAAAVGLLAHGVLGLLLGADEEHLAALRREVPDEVVSVAEHLDRLLQVDDVDAVPRAEDVGLHLRIPATGLVSEVHPGLEQVLHGDVRHTIPWSDPLLRAEWEKATTSRKRRRKAMNVVTGSSSPGTPGWPWCPGPCRAGTPSPRRCSAARGASGGSRRGLARRAAGA